MEGVAGGLVVVISPSGVTYAHNRQQISSETAFQSTRRRATGDDGRQSLRVTPPREIGEFGECHLVRRTSDPSSPLHHHVDSINENPSDRCAGGERWSPAAALLPGIMDSRAAHPLAHMSRLDNGECNPAGRCSVEISGSLYAPKRHGLFREGFAEFSIVCAMRGTLEGGPTLTRRIPLRCPDRGFRLRRAP